MSQEKNEKLGFSKKSSGVVLKDVTKIFQQPDTGKDFVAVDHINLEIKDGEMVTLLGPFRLRQDHHPADDLRF